MKTKDDDGRGGRTDAPATMIVPGGDLDAVGAKDGGQASSITVERPAIDPACFDAQRVMAPGGDLDAIDLDAGITVADQRPGAPVGPTAPYAPHPTGDEREMIFRESGPFVDSGPDDSDGHEPQFNARTRHGRSRVPRDPDAQGFRFRDGTDDPPSPAPGNFHDGDSNAVVRADREPPAAAGHARKTFPHAPEIWKRFRSPAGKRDPQPNAGGPGDEPSTCIDASTSQLEEVVGRIMERVFVEKVEAMLQTVLEEAVEREMRNFRRMLAREIDHSGGFVDGGER
jgi:hypothetical protein